MTTKYFLKDAFGWGLVLWMIGYILGIVFFFFLPVSIIGWVITPLGILITLLVLTTAVKPHSIGYFAGLAFVWTAIAIIFDYFLIVKTFKPADGYYKLDVYLYYALTFILPLLVGWRKSTKLHGGVAKAA